MDKFTQFKQEIEKLHHLLQDEQNGLFSWYQLLNERMIKISQLYYGKSVPEIETNVSQNVEVDDENDYQLEHGNKIWRNKKDQIHRDNDLPAIIRANGTQLWYKKGKWHRDNDKPAVIHADGTQEWYKKGQLHRDNDLPAIICANGDQEWYKEGVDYIPSSTSKKPARKI